MDLKERYEHIYRKPAGAPCNICELPKVLTDDHVPPKSCLEKLSVQLEPFEHRLRAKRPPLPLSQSGVRFRTLCGDCNSRLGRDFDPALAHLVGGVRQWLRSPLALGDRWSVVVRTDLVVKALFGHLLAATTDDAQTRSDRAMRDYVNGNHHRPTAETSVFYWLHDGPSLGLLRGVAMPAVRGHFDEIGIFSIMKVPPLAFMVTNVPGYEGLPHLAPPSTNATDPSIVRFSASLRRDEDWPERVEDGNFLAGGASLWDGLSARPWKKQKPGERR